MKNQVRYSELRRQASEERDAKKLIELVKEINRILMEERAATSRNHSLSAADWLGSWLGYVTRLPTPYLCRQCLRRPRLVILFLKSNQRLCYCS